MVRRIISAGLALVLLIGGGTWLVNLLFFTERFKGLVVIAASVMLVTGVVWLWSDLSEQWSEPKT